MYMLEDVEDHVEVLCGLRGLESLIIVGFDDGDEAKDRVRASVSVPITFVE